MVITSKEVQNMAYTLGIQKEEQSSFFLCILLWVIVMQSKLKWLVFLNYFVCAIGTTQLIPYIVYLGFNENDKSYMLSMIAVVTIVLQIGSGFISDKIKRIKIGD